jgi:hypothetical protein
MPDYRRYLSQLAARLASHPAILHKRLQANEERASSRRSTRSTCPGPGKRRRLAGGPHAPSQQEPGSSIRAAIGV